MASSTFGIVLLPDQTLESYVRTLIVQHPDNKLRDVACHVHLSLLHVVMEDIHLPRVFTMIDSVEVSGQIPLDCYEIKSQRGWHFLEVRRSPEILRVQEAILPAASLRSRDTLFSWRSIATTDQKRAYA